MDTTLMNRIMEYSLTKGQGKIADYILKNQKRGLGMTAKEIGKEIGVSDASVIRFARTIGFDGFSDMKEYIQHELAKDREKIGKHSLYDRFTMQTHKYIKSKDSINEVIQLMGINLDTSLRQNSEERYEDAADRLLKADKKVIIGLRGGKGCAVQFSRLLGHLTDKVSAVTEESHDQLAKLTELDESDAAIFLNFPRYYKIDEKIGEILSERNVYCCLITDSMESPVVKYADEVLLVETEHCGFFHSMIGVEGVLEYLLILMCWKEPQTFRQKLIERDKVLDEYRLTQ